jgi:hypothetical protein
MVRRDETRRGRCRNESMGKEGKHVRGRLLCSQVPSTARPGRLRRTHPALRFCGRVGHHFYSLALLLPPFQTRILVEDSTTPSVSNQDPGGGRKSKMN